MKTFRPFFFFAALTLVVGLACNALSGGAPTQAEQPVEPPQSQPTEEAPPTEAPVVTEAPTEEQPVGEAYYTEEFDTNDNWTYFVVDGEHSAITEEDSPKMAVFTENSALTFDLNLNNWWVYATYDLFEYENVRVDARVTNRGVNNNNVSLICRYTDSGWYEFNIANNGLYWIYAAEVNADNKVKYGLVFNGGSDKIKSGKETNEYSVICNGRDLSLFINGKEVRTIAENKYGYSSGKVGVSVSSFDVLPVTVDLDWVTISEP